MSEEIPIGSPPAPPGRHAAPPGWYADPLNGSSERYWDGWQWSRTTRVAEHPQPVQSPGSSGLFGGGYPGSPQQHPRWTPQSAAGRPAGSPGAAAGYGMQPAVATTADGVPLSGWGLRAVAAVIDLIGISLVGLLASLPFYLDFLRFLGRFVELSTRAAQSGAAPPATPDAAELMLYLTPGDQVWAGLISGAIAFAYFALLWRFRSATLGQLICGLRVVPADHGQGTPRLGWSQVVIRALVFVVPTKLGWPALIFLALNGLAPLWHPQRMAIHDRLARTQVVRVR